MEYKQAQSLIARLAKQIRLMVCIVAGLLVSNSILGALLWHQSDREHIVLIPAQLPSKAHITEDSISTSYLEAVASMIINERLNISPENISGSSKSFLSYVDTKYYASFKKQIEKDVQSIKKGKVSSSFYPSQVRSDPKNLEVVISGKLKRWVGTRFIGEDMKSYRLKFVRDGYLLLLASFKEVKTQ